MIGVSVACGFLCDAQLREACVCFTVHLGYSHSALQVEAHSAWQDGDAEKGFTS
jgi:hypothetical protein